MKQGKVVKNFRDLGASINKIANAQLFKERKIYRGGKLNEVHSHSQILNIPTIINLREGRDKNKLDCNFINCPANNNLEIYDTRNKKIREWINAVIRCLCDKEIKFPILIHCTSGKDRTGVISAAICSACGIEEKYIIQEYLLSEGAVDVRLIRSAIKGFGGNIKTYLNKANIKQLREKIAGNP